MIPALLVSLVRALRARLRGRRPAHAPLFVLPGALLVAALVAALGFIGARAAPPPPPPPTTLAAPSVDAATVAHTPPAPPPAIEPLTQLLRALDEAQRNCEAARGLVLRPGEPLFRTVELETALLENPWVVDRALGEVDTLLDECVWLADLAPGARPDEDGRTWEDVRFLLGGVHWYLERAWDAGARSEVALRASGALAGAMAHAPLPEPRRHELIDDYDRAAMRAFRDVATFEELLGRWD